jgi:hypothetical protein
MKRFYTIVQMDNIGKAREGSGHEAPGIRQINGMWLSRSPEMTILAI